MSAPTRVEKRLTVLLDIRQPLAYLALHPIATLAEDSSIDVDLLPIVDAPLKAPTAPDPDDDRGIRHRRARAQAVAREIETYAAAQGLTLSGYYRTPDPTHFNHAWLWVHTHRPDRLFAFLSESFRVYWSAAFDIEDEAAIAALLDSVDADATGFTAWAPEAREEIEERVARDWQERGLARAPTYLIDGEVFVGRQHLPMIKWMLSNRTGPPPI